MISLDEAGAFPSPPADTGVDVRFGVYLPGIDPQDGYEVLVRLIHKDDRFIPEIKTLDFPLSPVTGHPLQLWQARVTIPIVAGTNFGKPGTYLYRYQLRRRMPATGTLSVLTRW